MKERLEQIKNCALEAIQSASGMDELNEVKVKYLGKKGELSQLLKGMKNVAPEERPKVGQMVNDARQLIEAGLDKEKELIFKRIREEKMKREVIDVTLPGTKVNVGHRHPNQIAQEELSAALEARDEAQSAYDEVNGSYEQGEAEYADAPLPDAQLDTECRLLGWEKIPLSLEI